MNSASRANPKGLLLSHAPTPPSIRPARSLMGRPTIGASMMNKTADGTIKGHRAVLHGRAVWLSGQAGQRHGLQRAAQHGPGEHHQWLRMTGDLHGTEGTTMWLSSGVQPNWIQYQFDKAYKLYDLKVWNSNQPIETFIGFGAKKVTIEYSTDGTTWTAVANVPEFARASGALGYAANTTVNLGGVCEIR